MPEEFWPHRGAGLETRLNHLENWACQLGKRSPSMLGQRLSTAGGAVTGVPASAPGSPTWLLDGDVTGPPTGNTATGCVVLSPGFAGRNTIQPTGITVEALTLKRIAGQTANHLQWADETGAVQGHIAPSGATFLLSTAVGAPVMPAATTAANMLWGVSQNAYADTTCADEYITRVASDKTFLANFVMSVNNPAAPVPTRALLTWGIAGIYLDSGTLDPTNGIFFNNSQTGQTFLLIESTGSGNSRVAFGLGAVNGVWDGQLDIQPMVNTQKCLTLTGAAGQTANMLEVKNSSLTLLSYVTPSAGFVIGPGAAGAGLAPWKLTSGSLQTTAEAGALEFLTPTFSATPVTTRRALSLASNPITADVTVANTLTETLLFTGTIAANEMAAGKVLRARLYGRMSALVTDTVTLRFKMGGTTFLTVVSTAAAITGQEWSAEFVLTCRTTGAAGTVISQAICIINALLQDTTDTGTHVVDTTAAENVTVTAQWSAASASDSIVLQQGFLEVLN